MVPADYVSVLELKLKILGALSLTFIPGTILLKPGGPPRSLWGTALLALVGSAGSLLLVHAVANLARRAPTTGTSWLALAIALGGWLGTAAILRLG